MPASLELLDPRAPGGQRSLHLLGSGIANCGFRELHSAYFIKYGIGGWQFYVDDAPLSVTFIQDREVWEWSPGFYAGTVLAQLVDPSDRIAAEYLLDVSPDPAKLGQDTFRTMLAEIWASDPSLLLGDEPATTPIGQSGGVRDKSIEYARLVRYTPMLLQALSSIAANPHRVLRAARVAVPPHRVKVVDTHTARAALRSGAVFALVETAVDATRLDAQEALAFDVPFSEETYDSAANRCLAALFSAVARRVSKVRSHFQDRIVAETEQDTRTALKLRWPRRAALLDSLTRGLSGAMAREPLQSVTRPEITAAGLTAVAAHPLYARAQQIAWRILRPDFGGTPSDERAWMSPTWEIYERWCFVRLCGLLEEVFPELSWRTRPRSGAESCFEGSASHLRVSLLLQPRIGYRAVPTQETGFWSLSRQFIPDLVLTMDSDSAGSWLVLDAKYRQRRSNVVDAMDSAHLYHDALRRFERPPERSLLLVPAPVPDAAWLQERGFWDAHGVGVIALSPDHPGSETLAAVIRERSAALQRQ